jgi:uncharacterized protein (TIGR02246 family)
MTEIDSRTEAALKGVVNDLVAGWNRHDPVAFARPFALDADFTNVFGMCAKGRDTIVRFHAPIFETIFKDSLLAATETTIRMLRPDIAAVDLRWEMTGARDPLGNDWPMRRGLMNLVVTREGASWLIAIMHNMDLPDESLVNAQKKLSPA